MSNLEKEREELVAKAVHAEEVEVSLKGLTKEFTALEDNYKKEQALRKKYYNQIDIVECTLEQRNE